MIRRLSQWLRKHQALRAVVLWVRRRRDDLIDKRLNIKTSYGSVAAEEYRSKFDDPVEYDVVDYLLVRKFIKPLTLTSDDVVFDIGCGTGRVVCLFARRTIKKCVGLELSTELVRAARTNAKRLKGRKAPIEIIVADAAKADYSEGTVFYLFNPFGKATLAAMVERIRQSLDAHPRRIQIVYVTPNYEMVLRDCQWLKRVGVKQPWLYRTKASYWTNEAAVPRGVSHP